MMPATYSYSRNDRNKLPQVLPSGSSSTSATYQYDRLGRRVESLTGGTATTYLYDGINIVQEEFTYKANRLPGLSPDQIFARTDSGGTSSFLTNALGSTVALAGENGAIATQYAYSTFGDISSAGAASSNPYEFTGREADSTGVYKMQSRY